jgi:hypothetical protein
MTRKQNDIQSNETFWIPLFDVWVLGITNGFFPSRSSMSKIKTTWSLKKKKQTNGQINIYFYSKNNNKHEYNFDVNV